MPRALLALASAVACGVGVGTVLMRNPASPVHTASAPGDVTEPDPVDAGLRMYQRVAAAASRPTLDVSRTQHRPPKAEPSTGGPALEVVPDVEVLGLGVREQDTAHTHRMMLRNRGDAVLVVHRTVANCGCAQVSNLEPGTRIEPGQAIEASLRFTFGRMAAGDYSRRVTVLTNDPQTPRHEMAVQFRIVPVIGAEPSFADFGIRRPGEEGSAPLTLKEKRSAHPQVPWNVVRVSSSKQNLGAGQFDMPFEAQYTTSAAGERICELVVKHPPVERVGGYHKPVIIETTHPRARYVTIYASLRVVDGVPPTLQASPR